VDINKSIKHDHWNTTNISNLTVGRLLKFRKLCVITGRAIGRLKASNARRSMQGISGIFPSFVTLRLMLIGFQVPFME